MTQTATTTAYARPLRAPQQPSAPALRIVPVLPPRRSRSGLVIGCLALLVAGLVGLLQLNISLGHGSYEMYRLEQRQDLLAEQQQALEESLTAAQAPQNLAREAARLGLVPAPEPHFLRLSSPAGGVAAGHEREAAPSLDR